MKSMVNHTPVHCPGIKVSKPDQCIQHGEEMSNRQTSQEKANLQNDTEMICQAGAGSGVAAELKGDLFGARGIFFELFNRSVSKLSPIHS